MEYTSPTRTLRRPEASPTGRNSIETRKERLSKALEVDYGTHSEPVMDIKTPVTPHSGRHDGRKRMEPGVSPSLLQAPNSPGFITDHERFHPKAEADVIKGQKDAKADQQRKRQVSLTETQRRIQNWNEEAVDQLAKRDERQRAVLRRQKERYEKAIGPDLIGSRVQARPHEV